MQQLALYVLDERLRFLPVHLDRVCRRLFGGAARRGWRLVGEGVVQRRHVGVDGRNAAVRRAIGDHAVFAVEERVGVRADRFAIRVVKQPALGGGHPAVLRAGTGERTGFPARPDRFVAFREPIGFDEPGFAFAGVLRHDGFEACDFSLAAPASQREPRARRARFGRDRAARTALVDDVAYLCVFGAGEFGLAEQRFAARRRRQLRPFFTGVAQHGDRRRVRARRRPPLGVGRRPQLRGVRAERAAGGSGAGSLPRLGGHLFLFAIYLQAA